jgi:hypothetical protein
LTRWGCALAPVSLTGSEEEVRRVATDFKLFFEKVPRPGTEAGRMAEMLREQVATRESR